MSGTALAAGFSILREPVASAIPLSCRAFVDIADELIEGVQNTRKIRLVSSGEGE